jgi:transporter family-2 protein
MKNDVIFPALALLTGALIPLQAGTNAVFSKSVGNPLLTGLMVFIVGLVGMLVLLLVSKTALPTPQQLTAAPVVGYLGGLIVATYVVMITVLVPLIGVGPAIRLIVTGQILCAVAIDHFGFFNVAVRAVSLTRVAGLLLMVGGVCLVMKK